jgi:hypothetical protein
MCNVSRNVVESGQALPWNLKTLHLNVRTLKRYWSYVALDHWEVTLISEDGYELTSWVKVAKPYSLECRIMSSRHKNISQKNSSHITNSVKYNSP